MVGELREGAEKGAAWEAAHWQLSEGRLCVSVVLGTSRLQGQGQLVGWCGEGVGSTTALFAHSVAFCVAATCSLRSLALYKIKSLFTSQIAKESLLLSLPAFSRSTPNNKRGPTRGTTPFPPGTAYPKR